MDKFEQVFSNDHQMSVAGILSWGRAMGVGWGYAGSDVLGGARVRGGVLYSEVQYIMGKGHMGPLPGQSD